MSMKRKGATCCAPLLRARLGRDDAEALATAFKAIADPGRLRLLNFIARQPGAEACVCHLVRPLGLAQPTVRHHLKVLTEARLLTRERCERPMSFASGSCPMPNDAGRSLTDHLLGAKRL